MVTLISPIYIIAAALGVAFFTGIFGKTGEKLLSFLALSFMTFVSGSWASQFLFGNLKEQYIFTAGFQPPFSISLLMGRGEAIITLMINFIALLGFIYFYDTIKKNGRNFLVVFILMIMGLNVIVLTRDIFNLFVFLEISSIATSGLIIMNKNLKTFSAGFKYLIASAIISGLFLLAIIFLYYFSGSLNIDSFYNYNFYAVKGGSVAVFLLLISFMLELKPFPANGWALDVYEAVDPGLSAMISSASATASLFVLYKIIPLGNEKLASIVALIGILTFVFSNLFAIKQDKTNRLLGYSSVGQIGLLTFVIGMSKIIGVDFEKIFFGLLITHYLAKAGLFWLSGIVNAEKLKDWISIRKSPILVFAFATAIFALMDFPPFPSLAAKWKLILILADKGMFLWITLILIGSILEVLYLFRWFGYAMKLEGESKKILAPLFKTIPLYITTILLYVAGYYITNLFSEGTTINYLPLVFVGIMFFLDFLPVYIKNTIVIAVTAYYAWMVIPSLDIFKQIFAIIFLGGGVLLFIPGYSVKGKRMGFFPVALIMYAGLIGIVEATNTFQFFFSWELMTLGSYFLILRGKKAMPHALSYILFSAGGAYLILFGFALVNTVNHNLALSTLSNQGIYTTAVFILLAIGFMTKTASAGLHIWLPGAHAEAESDVSPMVSAVLLKAGVFGLAVLLISLRNYDISTLTYILAWVGAITALVGNLLASFQEDAKRLLAYSSIGQLGYIVFGIAIMTNIGWLAVVWYTVNHFLFKSLLFLAIGGVIYRVKTHKMYEMGGLIKLMPLSFISVLIGIIALSGVPPLSGFGGKWLLYNAFILKGWYLPGAVIAFSGVIAFLYCFRLIHSVFLGPIKDNLRKVKEAPIWYIIPQYIFIALMMLLSTKPKLLLGRVSEYFSKYFTANPVEWKDTTAYTYIDGKIFGTWDATMIMYIVMSMFAALLVWLLFVSRKAQKVKMFNIVYAGERPERPETTHFAYNMYSHYMKGMGFLTTPFTTKFWNFVTDFTLSLSDFMRKFYNGNGQVYVIHLIVFVMFFYFIS